MPKPATFPTLFDELKTVNTSFLRKHGYLKPNHIQGGILTWSRNGKETGSISIIVNTHETPYLELDYKCNGTPINYRVQLVTIPSNLGKGVVWYLICPKTGKRCSKLHWTGTYFFHRTALRGCLYEKQTQSKKYRHLNKTQGVYYRDEQLYQLLCKKHFKKLYAGKPTKRFQKIIKQINRVDEISVREFEPFMSM